MNQRLGFLFRPISVKSSGTFLPFAEKRSSTTSKLVTSANFYSKSHKSNLVSSICSILRRPPTGLKHFKKEKLVHQLGRDEIDAVLLRCQSDPVIALGFFDWVRNEVGIKPTTRNCSTVAHILAWSRLFSQAMRVLGDVVETDRQVFDNLIQATEDCNRNPIVFDILIKVYVQFGMVQAGMEVFRRMIGIGLVLRVNACNSLLNVLLKSSLDKSQSPCSTIYEEMRRMGVPPNAYTFNILTHALCMIGDLEKVKEFLEKLGDSDANPDVVTYNTLIDSYCKKKKLDEAFYLYSSTGSCIREA